MTREIWVHIEANMKSKQRLWKSHNHVIIISILSPPLECFGCHTLWIYWVRHILLVDERCRGEENTIFEGNWNEQESIWSAFCHDALGHVWGTCFPAASESSSFWKGSGKPCSREHHFCSCGCSADWNKSIWSKYPVLPRKLLTFHEDRWYTFFVVATKDKCLKTMSVS